MTPRPRTLVPACAALALAACACDSGPPRDPAGEGTVFVLTTDFETGAFSILDPQTEAAAVNVGLTHSDAAARVRGDRVYVLNRLGQDNVTALDAANRFRVLWQRSTEPGSNPQDIAVAADDKAYVTRLDHRTVLILDPRDGSTRGEVDVSAYADADGFPEMSSALALDGRVILAAGRLDRNNLYLPAARGLLVVVDPATDAIERTIELTGENPYGDLAPVPGGGLLVAEVGRFGALDGGIEEVDVATGTARGFRVTEETLGGDVSGFTVASDGSWWIVISDPSAVTSVVRFDPADGSRRTIVVGTGFTLSCAAEVETGVLAVCDRTRTAPGIRLFGLDGVERTVAPIDVGLPPWQVRVLDRS
jgi:DNA-binding beta-propeller fold protein YncE